MTIEERLAVLETTVAALNARITANAEAAIPYDLASDQYANFTIRKSPPQWIKAGGHDYAGSTIDQTTPEFCDALASFLTWTATKDEEANKSYINAKGATVFPAKFARKDAARCRAWAKKMRDAGAAALSDADESGIPF